MDGRHAVRLSPRAAGADRLRGGKRPAVHGDPDRRLHHGEPVGGQGLRRLDAFQGPRRPARVQAVQNRLLLPVGRRPAQGIRSRRRRDPRRQPRGADSHHLSARRRSQYHLVPQSLPDNRHQPQPGALALDLLSLPRRRHREVRLPHDRPGGAGGHQQPDHAQAGLHRVPHPYGSGGRGVPVLQRRRVLQACPGRPGFPGRPVQGGGRRSPGGAGRILGAA